MNVLVYGGTGLQGQAIVRNLVQRGHVVRFLARNPEEVTPIAGVTSVAGDLGDPASLTAANAGVEAVALTLPAVLFTVDQAVQWARNAIEAAKAAGVRLIVFNTSGPIVQKHMNAFAYDMRPLVVNLIRNSGIPYIVLMPGTYMENLLGPWTQPGIVERDVLEYPIAEGTPAGWIALNDLGALVAAAIEHSELAPWETPVSGIENLTGTELAARFSEALGRTITYQAMPLDEFNTRLEALFGQGAGAGILPGYELMRDDPAASTQWTDMRPVLAKLPVQMTSVVEWVRQVAPMLTPQAEPV